ncbi:MAG: hypothetical protein JO179_06650 [Solirubrobacterales bacterium]|nr:hypothetical protein [Solirubrobacterales bacterium]
MRRGAALGAVSGVAGAAALAAVSKLEQQFTHRPDSYIPAHTLARLFGLEDPDRDDWGRNMAMHYASGAIAGMVRGVMSASNLRGPFASLMHANIRLSFDQTLENATGAGAPPWTQPSDELALDIAEKSVFALVTGLLTDALVAPLPHSSVQRPHLGRRLKGHA